MVNVSIRSLTAIAILAALGGCYGVSSDQPVGAEQHRLDAGEWEGTWLHGEGVVTVAVTRAEAGQLEIGWLEKKHGKLSPEVYEVEIRRSGRQLYGNVRDPRHPGAFLWAPIDKHRNEVVIWVPDRERIMEMVKTHQIGGRPGANGEDVLLTGFKEDVLATLMRDSRSEVLDVRNPRVFRRLLQ